MSDIGRSIDAAIDAGLRDLLRAAGFSRSSRTYLRRRPDITTVVNVQASRSNSVEGGRFTVNIGLYLPAVQALLGDPPEMVPTEPDCAVRTRLGFLMPGNADFWWTVGPPIDSTRVGAEVAKAFADYGLPWIDSHAKAEDILQSRTPLTDLTRGALLAVAGRQAEAATQLHEGVLRQPMARGAWRAFAERAGLLDEFRKARDEAQDRH